MEDENNSILQLKLKTVLAEKITANQDLPRRLTSCNINSDIMDKFCEVAHQSGLLQRKQGINRALEAFMEMYNDLYAKDSIQVNLFYKPTINNTVVNKTVNVTERIEVKLVKEELTAILGGYQKTDAPATYAKFLSKQLKKTLPKAIRVQGKVHDPELEALLVTCEKYLK